MRNRFKFFVYSSYRNIDTEYFVDHFLSFQLDRIQLLPTMFCTYFLKESGEGLGRHGLKLHLLAHHVHGRHTVHVMAHQVGIGVHVLATHHTPVHHA